MNRLSCCPSVKHAPGPSGANVDGQGSSYDSPPVTPYELEVVDSDRENVTLLELRGELDLTNASDVERQVTGLAGGRPGLVLDLNSVAFIDSAALQMLFRLARRFDGPQLGLVLAPGALVARTLAIVGLGEVASIGSTVDELVVEPRS